MTNTTICVAAASISGLLFWGALAHPYQDDATSDDAMPDDAMPDDAMIDDAMTDEAMQDSDLLRGPTVADDATRTLINVDMGGNFVRVQGRPEEAALGLVIVDPDRRQQAQAAAAARRTSIGMLLIDNIDLVKEASDAVRAGENQTVQRVYREIYSRFDPDQIRDPLLADFAQALSAEEQQQVVAMVDDYWTAWIDWELRNRNNPNDAMRARTEQRLAFSIFQREIGEAYNWALRPFQQRMEALYEMVEPTEEQRSAIRDAMIEYIREARLEPTPEQRRKTADEIYMLFTEEQHQRLFERMLWRM